MLIHQHRHSTRLLSNRFPLSPSAHRLFNRQIHHSSPHDLALPQPSSPAPSSDRPVRLRFAPSPTGYLHLGGLRTALFNHLLARKWGGKWILRIEDTDRARFVPGSVDSLVKTLEWAGLDFDEGPGRKESVGPYVQSERLGLYHQHVQTLLDQDKAYRCFCPPSKLAEIQQSQLKSRQTSSYDGTCRHLTDEEVTRRRKAGEKSVVRFKSQKNRKPVPEDLIFGSTNDLSGQRRSSPIVQTSLPYSVSEITSPLLPPTNDTSIHPDAKVQGHLFGGGDDLDDFILLKSDEFPTYHFASVVDDFEMGISHVLRGEEWLPSTTKHIQLYHALGWQPPKFGHLPLLVNPNGTKLSKRSGDVQVEDYIKRGYEPDALLNFLALMGWDHLNSASQSPTTVPFFPPSDNPDMLMEETSSNELFTMTGLVEAFDLKYITRRRAIVNFDKLDWVNRMHLRRQLMLPGDAGRNGLVLRFKGFLKDMKVLSGNPLIEDAAYVDQVMDAELSRVKTLSELPKHAIHYFLPPRYENPEAKKLLASVQPKDYVQALEAVLNELESQDKQAPWDYDSIWEVIHKVIADLGYKRKPQLITPLRHAITGRTSGASLPLTMSIIGRDASIERLRLALDYVGHVREGPAEASDVKEEISPSVDPIRGNYNVIEELKNRGFVQALTSPSIADAASNGACVYSGVDPSASSLHLGNLLPLLVLLHFQLAGNKVLALIGGATGSIGDPSGRSSERNALSREELDHNVKAIHNQVRIFFDRGLAYAKRRIPDNGAVLGEKRILNNLDWTQEVTLLDFLRGVGKHSRVNTMLARDSVKNRLASESGISFTEFTYQLLQAFDFRQLHYDHRCQIQVGGSDQWGNIVAGIDLIKRSKAASAAAAGLPEPPTEDPAFGLTIPLLTTSSGEKFGKSAGNALWLDSALTSVTTFYQYFFRSADADVEKYLKLFTMLPLEEITQVMERHNADPRRREAQRLLADEVTHLVHGADKLARAQTAMRVLFDSDISLLSPDAVAAAFEGDPRLFKAPRAELIDVALPRLIASAKHARSKSEAARLINGGGVSLNGVKVDNATAKLLQSDLHQAKFAVLRIGKASHIIIYATD